MTAAPCAAGSQCIHAPQPPADPPLRWPNLCDPCHTTATRAVTELPRDYAALNQRIGDTGGGDGPYVRGAAGPTVPLNEQIDATQRAIVWSLTVWEPAVRETAGLPPETTRRVRDAWAVTTAARVIAPRIDLLAELGPMWCYADGWAAGPVERTGVDAITTFRRLHHRARHLTGTDRLTHHLPGDCSHCGATALRRQDGNDTVWCALCDSRWTVDDYHRYVGLQLADRGVRA